VLLDEAYWSKVITRPDWYIEFLSFIKKTEPKLKGEELNKFRYTCRHFFELALQNETVSLAKDGPNMDTERMPVDTLVIHHTSNQPGYRLSYMNAVHLLNIYVPYFVKPTIEGEKELKGRAVWSGHLREDKSSFLAYHWFMRMDGSFERLLEDNQIGWHAGNWDINKRSVAICMDNDYENQDPTDEILKKLAEFIKKNYSRISTKKIIGHREANPKTTCPGNNFLGGWNKTLLSYIRDA
jgi:hypothetical protein